MIKPEQGPGDMGVLAKQVPKASITALRGLICCGCDTCLSKAIAAALKAWPGAYEEYMNDEDGDGASVCVILPKGGDDE